MAFKTILIVLAILAVGFYLGRTRPALLSMIPIVGK